MNVNKLVVSIVGLVVGLSILAGLLVPIASSAQANLGDPIELSNDFDLAHEEYYHKTDSVHLTSDGTSATIDGHTVTYDSQFRVLVASDTFYAIGHLGAQYGITIVRYAGDSPGRLDYAGDVTLTCENGQYSFTSSLGTHTGTYGKLYAVCDKSIADTCTVRPLSLGNYYLPSDYQLFFISDITNTGYMIYDGVAHTLTGTGDVTYTKGELVNSTTDIYTDATMNISYNGVDANMAVVFVPLTVEGHSTSGAEYSLVGVIPLLAIVVVVVFAANMIRTRN